MFTGIIESTGKVTGIEKDGANYHFSIQSEIADQLKIDQSVSHNGVCLTVVSIEGNTYTVTAIDETLKKSNLGELQVDSLINLERSMLMGGRLDGHIVQGHVDTTGKCAEITEADGSWYFKFEYDPVHSDLLVEKGSICINGVSLTLVDVNRNHFSVAIIPYTYEHTNFSQLKKGSSVNLEFDVIGKYVQRMLSAYKN